jgi:hypothetical protein
MGEERGEYIIVDLYNQTKIYHDSNLIYLMMRL